MAKKTGDSDIAFIDALAKLLRAHDLTELDITRIYGSDDKLIARVARKQEVIASVAPLPTATLAPAFALAASNTRLSEAASEGVLDPANDPNAVTSPMVGTAYLATEPGTPSFVSVGDVVAEGDTLMIIEAMKTMNHIPAPKSGTVRRIFVDDGSPVEFGALLMIVE